jgi:hypothetical protein
VATGERPAGEHGWEAIMAYLRGSLSLAALWLALVPLAGELEAQSLWLERQPNRALYLEILKPSFDDTDLTFLSATFFLSGRYAFNEKLALFGELPFANGGIENFGDSDFTVGNLYAGLEYGRLESGVFGEFGVRVPLASEDNFGTLIGLFSDWVDRFEAFTPDVFSIIAAFNYRYRSGKGFGTRVRVAPILDIPTENGGDPELFALYSLTAWYESDIIGAGGGFSGRAILTEDGSVGERSLHQLGLFANLKFGRWHPGAQLRLPLDDDLTEFINLVFSLSVGYRLN